MSRSRVESRGRWRYSEGECTIVNVAEAGEVASKRQAQGRETRDWNGSAEWATGVLAVLLIMAEGSEGNVYVYSKLVM